MFDELNRATIKEGLITLEERFGSHTVLPTPLHGVNADTFRVLVDGEHPKYFYVRHFEGMYATGTSPGFPPSLDIVIYPYLNPALEEDKRVLDGQIDEVRSTRATIKFVDALREAYPGHKIFFKNPDGEGLIEADGIYERMKLKLATPK